MTTHLRMLPFFARFRRPATGSGTEGMLLRALLLSITFALILVVSGAQTAAAQSAAASAVPGSVNEQQIKAAYLYKFLNYAEWPESAFDSGDAPYVIGVMDSDEIADILSKITEGRRVNNRPVTVKRLHAGEPLGKLHMVFIDDDDKQKLPQLLKNLPAHVLSVTETDGALAQGSMINFRLSENKVRFEIALDAVDKGDLKLSSRLLAVAISVKGARK